MQRGAGLAEEVQIEYLPLPVLRPTFNHKAALRQKVVGQVCERTGRQLHQRMAYRAAQVLDVTVIVQIHLQADALHQRGIRAVRQARRSIEQAAEQGVARTQNCRLEEARNVAGRRGTGPIPGSTRNGSA